MERCERTDPGLLRTVIHLDLNPGQAGGCVCVGEEEGVRDTVVHYGAFISFCFGPFYTSSAKVLRLLFFFLSPNVQYRLHL